MKKAIRKYVASFFLWWKDNLNRPSTWMGFVSFTVAVSIYNDKDVLHDLLQRLVGSSEFLGVLIGVLSGALIAHKPEKNRDIDKKD